MSNQIVISSGAKVRDLEGVLTGTAGIVNSVGLGQPNGVATLDSSGKVPLSQLPASVITYLGTWNASTNTPTLTNGVGDDGDLYICNVAGTVNFGAGPITFAVGDWVIYGSGTWQKSAGASGTVTSVAVSRSGDALSITGSPITTSGTINIGFAGNSGQYIDGSGNLTTFPSIITQAQNLVTEVYNSTGATLLKGTVVYINGGHGNLPTVAKAIATSDATSAQTYGVVRADITNNNNGYVTVFGNIDNLDTQAYSDGTQLYLSGTTAGAWTSTKPSAPIHLVYVGIVTRSHPTQGVVEIRIQNGYELAELHDVAITSVANNDGIFYNSSNDLWENKTIAEVLGYTPANDSLVVKLAGTQTITGQKTFTSLIYANNNIVLPIAGSSSITYLANIAGTGMTSSGANYIGFNTNNDFYFAKDNYHSCVFVSNNSAVNYYTLQDGSGTLAFTSDIPSLTNYVTLTGAQTITGIKTFTNEQLFGNGITLQGGYITYKSGSFNLTLNTNLLTANRNVFIKDGSGTLAFTSDIPSLSGYVQGSGTTNYHAKFTASSTIGNSMLTDDGTTLQSIGATRSNLYLKAASSSYYSQLAFTNGSNGSFGGISYNNSGQYMQFEANGSEWMRLNSDGKFLINGTSASNYFKLQVFHGSAEAGLLIKATNSGRYAPFEIRTDTNATQFTVLETGNVGIGTSSPNDKLTIKGQLGIERSVNSDTSTISNEGGNFFINAASGYNTIFQLGGTERMRITSGGQVSVGTSSASATALFYLKAPASSTVWSFGPNNYNATNIFRVENSDTTGVYLTSGNTSWTANSDERLKNITENIENAINTLLTLRAVKYTWKKDTSGKINLGLIAQDVIKVLPEVVDINEDEDKTLGVKYTELVPVLIAAIQELSAKVSALENKA